MMAELIVSRSSKAFKGMFFLLFRKLNSILLNEILLTHAILCHQMNRKKSSPPSPLTEEESSGQKHVDQASNDSDEDNLIIDTRYVVLQYKSS